MSERELNEKLGRVEEERDALRAALEPFVVAYAAVGFEFAPDRIPLAVFDKARAALSASHAAQPERENLLKRLTQVERGLRDHQNPVSADAVAEAIALLSPAVDEGGEDEKNS